MKEWPYVYLTNRKKWRCDIGEKLGKAARKRKDFDTEAEARRQAKDWFKEYGLGGKQSFMDSSLRLDALNARKLLDDRQVKDTLLEAAQFYLKHRYPLGGDLTLIELVNAFVEAKKRKLLTKQKISKDYLVSFHRFKVFADPKDGFGSKKCSDLRGNDIFDWLMARPSLNDESKKQHFRYYRMLLEWGVQQKYLAENPLRNIDQPHVATTAPGILTIPQVEALVMASWHLENKRFFPYVILGLYCGVRPHELQRLKWSNIVGGNSFIQLPASLSKTNDIRNIPIPACARSMLYRYSLYNPYQSTDSIVPVYWAHFKKQFREKILPNLSVPIDPWPHDGIRHTFASYFLDATNDRAQLMARLGHSTLRTTMLHYVNLVAPDKHLWKFYFTQSIDNESKAETQAVIDRHTTLNQLTLKNDPNYNQAVEALVLKHTANGELNISSLNLEAESFPDIKAVLDEHEPLNLDAFKKELLF